VFNKEQYWTAKRSWPTSCSTYGIVNTMDDNCKQQIVSIALHLQQLPTLRGQDDCRVWLTTAMVCHQVEQEPYCLNTFFETRISPWGRICWTQQTIRGDNFHMVFHSNYGSILLSFPDMIMEQTTNDNGPMLGIACIAYLAFKAGQQ